MARAHYSPTACEDIDGIAAYIATDNPTAARRFLLAVEDTVKHLLVFPGLGALYPHPSHPNLRAKLVNGFKSYIIFYTVSDDGILVVRVLHGARDIPRVLD